jgi:oligopeptide transport system ATP-binding protein
LLLDLQTEFGTAMLFISHNLAVVRHISHRVLVMYLGRSFELASREVLFSAPVHPYTRALLAAVPDPTRALGRSPQPLGGELPSADASPSGCVFRNRCAYAQPACAVRVPEFEQVGAQHAVACHRWRELVYS